MSRDVKSDTERMADAAEEIARTTGRIALALEFLVADVYRRDRTFRCDKCTSLLVVVKPDGARLCEACGYLDTRLFK